MHVHVPQAKTWVKIDVAKDVAGFAANARGAECRVPVGSIRSEIEDRLSMFVKKEMCIYKCSAEVAQVKRLDDTDDVRYLTWLIAWAEDCNEDYAPKEGWNLVDQRIKWSYEAPTVQDDGSLMKVLIYIDPLSHWEKVFIPNLGNLTAGKLYATVKDMKRIIAAHFEEVVISSKVSLLNVDAGMLEVFACEGSYPKGPEMRGSAAVYDGKWHCVTRDNMLSDIDKLDQDDKAMKAADEDAQ